MKTSVCTGIIGASALSLASCEGKSKPMETSVLPIGISTLIVGDITLTKGYSGYLSSQLKVGLIVHTNGCLYTSYPKAGNRVKRGNLIFVIESNTYQDNVTQAEVSIKTLEAQLEYACSNYECIKEAAKDGTVSRIQVIQAEAVVSESGAAVKDAEAELNTARTDLSYYYIRAPFDGAVTRASYDIGNHINGAVQSVALATLYKDDLVFTNFSIEDNQFIKMMLEAARNDSTVKFSTGIFVSIGKNGGNAYTGRLDCLSLSIDLSAGALNVRADLGNPEHVSKSGLYAIITLPHAEQPNVILVCDASIGTGQLGRYLYIVNDSNVVRYRPIEVDQLVDDALHQVTVGISPKDSYVTSTLLKVRDGMITKPIK